ncbi:hypothetical protein QZH41_005060 [Actinostola sp. cb2023]|nr:hypothetical protein QZH41_005060 [Actinostola sp. cb2023]
MKPRCKYRFVFFVCLLLLGEEFAKAKSYNEPLDEQFHKNRRYFEYEYDDDDEDGSDDDDVDYGSGYDDDASSPTSAFYEDKAEMDQNYIESTADMFGRILCKLNEIDADSEKMFQQISPRVLIASKNASFDIEQLVKKKNETMEKVSYLEVDGLYRTRLQNALAISMPALSLAMPAAFQMFKFARKRYRQRRVGILESDLNADFDLPPKTNTGFKDTKFGQWIGRQQTKFKQKMIKLKRKFNISFTKIKSIATGFIKTLKVAAGLAIAVVHYPRATVPLPAGLGIPGNGDRMKKKCEE